MVWQTVYNYFYGREEELGRQEAASWYEENHEAMKAIVSGLLEGRHVALDEEHIRNLDVIPDWVDKDKVREGQRFCRDYLYIVSFTELISIYLLLAVDDILRPLIFTDKSSTVETAYKRYLSTIVRVYSWYETDLFNPESEARRNIRRVNQMHCGVQSQMLSKSKNDLAKLTRLENRLKEEFSWSGCPFIREDLEELSGRECLDAEFSSGYISQSSMAVTQYAFMGLMLLCHDQLGVQVSKDVMESYVHMWRYIGHLIGIRDKYNICVGSYDQVVLNCRAITELIVKPDLARVTPEWEHMSAAVCRGVDVVLEQLTFESTVAVLLYLLGSSSSHYVKTFSWNALFRFYYYRFIQKFLTPLDFSRGYLNNYVRTRVAMHKSKNKTYA